MVVEDNVVGAILKLVKVKKNRIENYDQGVGHLSDK